MTGGEKKPPLVIVAGPTAAGKTSISIGLAKAINGSVVSADSVQVYRHMDIGSAKITPQEMEGIPHYLIDVLDPSEPFDVTAFQEMAKEAFREIYSQGRVPILVGGTGFYIQAVLRDVAFEEEGEDHSYREFLEKQMEAGREQVLFGKLVKIDPASAKIIHPHNHKRVVRALEFYHNNGYPISLHNAQQHQKKPPYTYTFFVLSQDRHQLYGRIEKRVDLMLQEGLVDEVKGLIAMGYGPQLSSMQSLGYHEICGYLAGNYSLEEAAYLIKRNTRHFAKRQLTWFRRQDDVVWLDKGSFRDESELLNKMLEILREKKIYED